MTNEETVMGTDASSLIEELGKAFLELESHTSGSEDNVPWVDIEQHFQKLRTTLKEKSEELDAREKEFVQKKSEASSLLAEREAAVVAKEQSFIDRLQELKEAAVTAIAEAREKHRSEQSEPVDGVGHKDSEVSTSLGESNSLTASKEISPHGVEGLSNEVKPRPELMRICQQMNAKELVNFALENRKKLAVFRDELSIALESLTEPAHLVLDSLEGFYPPDETVQQGDNKKDPALQGLRRSCVTCLEAMSALLARAGSDHLLNPETKQQAKAIALEWKPRLAGAANGNSLEAEAFLQLLATFSIASEFDEDELCKLVLAVAHRRHAPELCRSLGLARKVPEITQDLINRGSRIDAVHFVHVFGLEESFPLVPLLEKYLQDTRNNLQQGKDRSSGNAGGAQNQANMSEIAALREVIRRIGECKLEMEYPPDPLKRRIAQLEKMKADKKRAGNPNKNNARKKARVSGAGFYGFHATPASVGGRQAASGLGSNRATVPYMGMAGLGRYPPAGPRGAYSYPLAYVQKANEPKVSYYSQEARVASDPSPYSAAALGYGGYGSSGMQPSSQQPLPYM